MRTLLMTLSVVGVTGCALGDGLTTTMESATGVDAGPDAAPECPSILANYGDVGSIEGRAHDWSDLEEAMIVWQGDFYLDEYADGLAVELHPNRDPFGPEPVRGTYEIDERNLDMRACGVCVWMWADAAITEAGGEVPANIYLPTSGTVEVESISPRFAGRVHNLVLTHVQIDDVLRGTPVGDCTTTIESLEFDAELE